jgi:hypothetical protein
LLSSGRSHHNSLFSAAVYQRRISCFSGRSSILRVDWVPHLSAAIFGSAGFDDHARELMRRENRAICDTCSKQEITKRDLLTKRSQRSQREGFGFIPPSHILGKTRPIDPMSGTSPISLGSPYYTGSDPCFFARILLLSDKSACASLQSPFTSQE